MNARITPEGHNIGLDGPLPPMPDILGSPQGMLELMFGAPKRPITLISFGDGFFGEGDLKVDHPIFGTVNVFDGNSEIQKAGALLGELAYAQYEVSVSYEAAHAAFHADDGKRSIKKTIDELRGRVPEVPDESEIQALDEKAKSFGDVIEVLAAITCMMDKGLVDGTVFDQVVESLGIANLLGHPVESVMPFVDPEEPPAAPKTKAKANAQA